MAEPSWTVVVPVKRLDAAKSRLRGAIDGVPHELLALALAEDTVSAALACAAVGELLVVTDDREAARVLGGLGARIVPEPPGAGLNPAFALGASLAADRWVAALTADLPALRPTDLAGALRSAMAGALGSAMAGAPRSTSAGAPRSTSAGAPRSTSAGAWRSAGAEPAGIRRFVADAPGTGTVLLTAPPGIPLDPRFGPRSAAAHAASGARPLTAAWPTLRRDVDTPADLAAAAALGLGRHTAALGWSASAPPRRLRAP